MTQDERFSAYPERVKTDKISSILTRVVHGRLRAPRGQATREIIDACLSFDTDDQLLMNFPSRKLNLGYLATEMMWYLRADNADASICEHAEIWKRLSQTGKLQSNYGEYIFAEGQLARCVETLTRDPDSRQACIMILRGESYAGNAADIPCTLGMQFLIRDDALELIVTMRSQDVIFGAGSDWPIFAWTQELCCALLRNVFPELLLGRMHYNVGSLHVYERHFQMVETMTWEEACEPLALPRVTTPAEALYLSTSKGQLREEDLREDWLFSRWLNETSNLKPWEA